MLLWYLAVFLQFHLRVFGKFRTAGSNHRRFRTVVNYEVSVLQLRDVENLSVTFPGSHARIRTAGEREFIIAIQFCGNPIEAAGRLSEELPSRLNVEAPRSPQVVSASVAVLP